MPVKVTHHESENLPIESKEIDLLSVNHYIL
jgi:hypothetical protein